jgi:alkanesulfonate monooxygenase SsuD/methylene tetrahydromethanopterin reductase-like flavin-dependent oxidoreductase (luciferase family)
MTDHQRSIQFGYFLTPTAADYPSLVRSARLADDLGLDLIGIQDHPYQRSFLDTWTLLTAIGVQTANIRLFPDVANLPLRPPAVLAKAAASLDVMTNGRVELGLGAGGFWEAIHAMGGPKHEPRDAVAALEEAIQVIRLMWSGERSARFDGSFYSLRGVHPGPVPAHPIGIWLGALGPRMLDLTGRLADGWLPSASYVPPPKLPALNRRIDDAAASAGRDPAAVRRIYNVFGRITDDPMSDFLQGPVEHWVEQLTALSLEYGMDGYIFGTDADHDVQLRRFALEVAPRVRENVARLRAATAHVRKSATGS